MNFEDDASKEEFETTTLLLKVGYQINKHLVVKGVIPKILAMSPAMMGLMVGENQKVAL